MTVAQAIRALHEYTGETAQTLAARLEMNALMLTCYELGQKPPTRHLLRFMSAAHNAQRHDLYMVFEAELHARLGGPEDYRIRMEL